jgi:2'-5' RNA ligase
MRLFIAINFDEETRNNILAVQRRLKEKGRGRFTSPDNLHLTLAFLGDVAEADVGKIEAAMESVSFPELSLSFEAIGCFRREGELWWLGLREDPALMKLQKDLTAALRAAGFSPDTKRFRPHITLARDMSIGSVKTGELLPVPFQTTCRRISLMSSNYPARKIEYTELYNKNCAE